MRFEFDVWGLTARVVVRQGECLIRVVRSVAAVPPGDRLPPTERSPTGEPSGGGPSTPPPPARRWGR